jgi:hypothetical protein
MPKPTKDPGPISFTATIEQPDDFPSGAYITFPYDLKELYGIGNLIPVKATFDDVEYRGSIAKMGGPAILILRKDVRAKLGKKSGDKVDVTIEVDSEPRPIDVPVELQSALDGDPDARSKFESMALSHRREYARWVGEAKKEETRLRRASQAIEMVWQGKARM